jgi:hypothetical protein
MTNRKQYITVSIFIFHGEPNKYPLSDGKSIFISIIRSFFIFSLFTKNGKKNRQDLLLPTRQMTLVARKSMAPARELAIEDKNES